MAVDIIQLPPDSTGKKVAARSYTEGANTVYAQAGYLTTDTAGGNPAVVSNAVLAGTEYALATRSLIQGTSYAAQTGSLTATGQSMTATGLSLAGSVTITLSGTYGFTTTPPTYIIEVSDNAGTTWYAATAIRLDTGMKESIGFLPANTLRAFQLAMGGFDQVRVRTTAWGTPSGTLSVRVVPTAFKYDPAPTEFPLTRVPFQLTSAFTAAAIEAIVTLTPTRTFVVGSTGTSFAVTAGKKARLTGMTVSTRNAGAAGQGVVCNLRVNPSGATVAGSPLVASVAAGSQLAIANVVGFGAAWFGDSGIELNGDGVMTFGVSQIGTATAGNTVTLYGYEF